MLEHILQVLEQFYGVWGSIEKNTIFKKEKQPKKFLCTTFFTMFSLKLALIPLVGN
jgi:hypothetical protein